MSAVDLTGARRAPAQPALLLFAFAGAVALRSAVAGPARATSIPAGFVFAAALFVGTLAWSRVFPAWLSWSGWAVAVALLFGFVFVPLILFAAWTLALGIYALRGGTPRVADVPATSRPVER